MTPLPIRSFSPFTIERVLAGMAFLLVPLALFAGKAVAPLFVITVVLVLALSFDARRIRALLMQPVALALAACLLLATASAFWSNEPAASLRSAAVMALTFFGGLLLTDTVSRLDERQRKSFFLGILAGGVLALALIFFERATNGFITRAIQTAKDNTFAPNANMMSGLNSGMSVLALFVWPWLLVLKNRYGTAVMFLGLLLCVGAIFLSNADTPALAFVAGLLVAGLSFVSRKAVLALFAALMIVGVTLAPLVPGMLPNPHTEAKAYSGLSNSGVHRLAIWRTVAEHITKAPVLGIGMNATRYLYSHGDRVVQDFATDDPLKKWSNLSEPIPLHAHNGVLQIWLELGGVGAFLFAGMLLMVLWRIRQGLDDGAATAARLAMLTSGIITFSLSFGPWQGWWQATIWLSIAVMSATGATDKEGEAR